MTTLTAVNAFDKQYGILFAQAPYRMLVRLRFRCTILRIGKSTSIAAAGSLYFRLSSIHLWAQGFVTGEDDFWS